MALAPDDAIAQLEREARDDKMAREVLADLHEDRGDTKRAQLWRDCQRDDVYALRFDQLPNRGKTRKRVTKMTDAETAMMKPCADEWIRIGLTTGKADRPLFEAAVDAIVSAFGLALSWIFAFVALTVRGAEAAQSAGFVAIFPLVFASSVFVPVDSMPDWLQTFAEISPVTLTADAARGFALGTSTADSLPGALAWIGGLLAIFIPLCVWRYRRMS